VSQFIRCEAPSLLSTRYNQARYRVRKFRSCRISSGICPIPTFQPEQSSAAICCR